MAKGGNSVDADGVLIVAHGANADGPRRRRERGHHGPRHQRERGARGARASSIASPPAVVAGTSAAPAASAISITGITLPAPVQVVYNQGSQPVADQPSAPLVDVVLGLVGSRARVVQPVVTDQVATSLARSLLGDGDQA